MKKIISLMIIVMLLLSAASCKKTKVNSVYTPDRSFGTYESESLKGYSIIAMLEGSVLVQKIGEQDKPIYLYNIAKDSFTQIGVQPDFYANTHDSVYYKNKVYWNYCSTQGEENEWIVKLACVDLEKGALKTLQDDVVYQALVPVSRCGDNILMYKGKIQGENSGHSYIEAYNTETGKFSTLISKIGNTLTGSGEFIEGVRGYEDAIYILCDKGGTAYIEKYSSEGKLLASYDVECAREAFNGQAFFGFEVLDNNIFFIETASNDSVLCTIKNNKAEIAVKNSYEDCRILDVCQKYSSSEKLFYVSHEKIFYWYKNGEMYEVELSGEENIWSMYVYDDTALIVLKTENGKEKYLYDSLENIMNSNTHKKIALSEMGKTK